MRSRTRCCHPWGQSPNPRSAKLSFGGCREAVPNIQPSVSRRARASEACWRLMLRQATAPSSSATHVAAKWGRRARMTGSDMERIGPGGPVCCRAGARRGLEPRPAQGRRDAAAALLLCRRGRCPTKLRRVLPCTLLPPNKETCGRRGWHGDARGDAQRTRSSQAHCRSGIGSWPFFLQPLVAQVWRLVTSPHIRSEVGHFGWCWHTFVFCRDWKRCRNQLRPRLPRRRVLLARGDAEGETSGKKTKRVLHTTPQHRESLLTLLDHWEVDWSNFDVPMRTATTTVWDLEDYNGHMHVVMFFVMWLVVQTHCICNIRASAS